MRYFPAFTSSVTLLLQPLVAACAAWIIFNETLGSWQILGAGIVLLGILLCHAATARALTAPRNKLP
jgi:drug/metabolite transporter (DMT)-like permease